MTIPASLSKLKSLFPVFVVGASVAITIKLLTESTPLTFEILQVKAEEDIKNVEYKDDLVPDPEPEPETPPKEDEPKSQEQDSQQDEKDEEGSEDQSEDNGNQEESKPQPEEDSKKQEDTQKKDQQPKSGQRALKTGNDPVLGILKKFFSNSKEKS